MESRHQKIKILFSIPNFDTAGSGKAVLKVAQGLDKKLFEPHIMCMHDRGAFFKVVQDSGIPVHIVQYTTPIKPYFKGMWNCFKISRVLKKINPDIIHSFHYGADYSEPLAAKMAGIKWIYSKKNMNWGGASKNGWRLRSYLANTIVAQNTDMLELFFKKYKKPRFIPRGVDTKEFVYKNSSSQLKKQWKLNENNRVVICVANLVPIKGIEILVHAFANIAAVHKDWILLIVGDTKSNYGQKILELTNELGLQKRILFTGKQQNINEYLSLAEVFVLTTLEKGEGSPVSFLEAMACGKYVLGSNISGIKDQLKEFPDHLIEAGNIEAWQMALHQAFSNNTLKNRNTGKLFRTHVLKNYGIEKEVSRCERLYLDIV